MGSLNVKVKAIGSFLTILSFVVVALTVTAYIFKEVEQQADLFDPVAIFLTWQQDPLTTMTIDWHTIPDDGERATIIQYRKLGDDPWQVSPAGSSHEFPHSDRIIHRVELTELEPRTLYQFRFGDDSKVYKFRTMPDNIDEVPLIFATGGDTGIGEGFRKMNRVVMDYDLDFISWGGDLSYADGDPAKLSRKYDWLAGIKETLIYDDGRVVPIVIAIGNHELFGERRLYSSSHPLGVHTEEEAKAYMEAHNLWEDKPTFFFDLFAFPGPPAYNVLDFGDYMSKIALDSDHHSSVAGAQRDWLEKVLMDRQGRPFIFPIYHVPAFPSHRSFTGSTSVRVRNNWVPLFEKYGVRVVFENHDHTYKRTYPIRDGQITADGIVYLGDGAWVAGPREGTVHEDPSKSYINKFASVNHGIIAVLQGSSQHFIMVNSDGVEFDFFDPDADVSPDEFSSIPPGKINLIYPPGTRIDNLKPVFSWEEDMASMKYQFQITKSNFPQSIKLDTSITGTEFRIPDQLESNKSYRWRVRGINDHEGPWSDAIMFYTPIAMSAGTLDGIPSEFMLGFNYPNPFNPVTTIRYDLPVSAHVDLRVYDVIGREVAVLHYGEQSAGHHYISFNSQSLPSGVYHYRIEARPSGAYGYDNYIQSRSMTLIK